MTLRELMDEIIVRNLNPNAEIIFVTSDLQRERFTDGILDFTDDYIELG